MSLLVAIIVFFPTHTFGSAISEYYSYNETKYNNNQLDIQSEIEGKDLAAGTSELSAINKTIPTGIENQKGSNLAFNSDLSILDNKSGLPLYWNDSSNICGSTYICKINVTDGWDDRQSFELSTKNNSSNTWSSIIGREIDVKPRQNYHLLSHMKLNKWATASHVAFEGLNETSKKWYQITQCPAALHGYLEWREFSCFITIPENTTKIRPVLNAGWSSQPNKEATTRFDSISVIKNLPFVTDPNSIEDQKGANLVSNSNLSMLPLYWNDSSNICGSTYNCKINGTDGWDDRQSIQLSTTNNSTNTWSWIKGREIDVKPGEKFHLVTHMKLNNWATASHIALEAFNVTSGKWYQFTQCPNGLEGRWEWREFRCAITIPENTTKIRLVLNAGWSSDVKQEAATWFDSISMVNYTPFVTDPNLKVEAVLNQGLENPTSMAFLGQDDILVLEKDKGTVRRIVNGTLLSEPVLDVPVASKIERGMLGIAIARHETDNRIYVFLYYTESATGRDGDDISMKKEPLGNRLYRYEYMDGKLTNPKLFLDLPALPGPAHNGGVLSIGHDNQSLYLLIGDVNAKTKIQNNSTGKAPDGTGGILRLTLDGQPMQGILGDTYPLNLYYAYGIRNSFGIDFDPITGKLWDTENGPEFGDELNLVEPGFNSGWDKVQGILKVLLKVNEAPGDPASEKPDNLVDFGGRGNYSSPEFTWNNVVGPTAMKFLSTDKLGKQYENDLLVADVNYHRIYHFEMNQNRTGLLLEGPLIDKVADTDKELNNVIFAGGLGLITDLEIGPDGYLYFVVFDEGKIYRVVPK